MLFESVLIGALASVGSFLSCYLFKKTSFFSNFSPLFILGIGCFEIAFGSLLRRRKTEREQEGPGISMLLSSLHFSWLSIEPLRWLIRSISSFFLSFTGAVGVEGSLLEGLQALRIGQHNPLWNWLQQKRRIQLASYFAASISAAFGAPFAGVLIPFEMGIGGGSIFPAVSALIAYLTFRFLMSEFSVEFFDAGGILAGFRFFHWREWLACGVIGLISGLLGVGCLEFFRRSSRSFLELSKRSHWMKYGIATLLLSLIYFIYPSFCQLSQSALEKIVWLRYTPDEILLFLGIQFLSLFLVWVGFGKCGVFWPLFLMGGSVGFCIHHWFFTSLVHFSAVATFTGGVSFWGVILGAPVSGAVAAYELTQNPGIILPCLISGIIAQKVREAFRVKTLIDQNLKLEGVQLVDGKSASILSALKVKDVMETHFVSGKEKDSVSDLIKRLDQSNYPFIPIVNAHGTYVGMLTADLIQKSHIDRGDPDSSISMRSLLEAKDLLYHTRLKVRPVQAESNLLGVSSLLNQAPCVPVLDENRLMVGLLFNYNIRLAYEREWVKRSFRS